MILALFIVGMASTLLLLGVGKGTGAAAPGGDALLLEDGTELLLEDGTELLLE